MVQNHFTDSLIESTNFQINLSEGDFHSADGQYLKDHANDIADILANIFGGQESLEEKIKFCIVNIILAIILGDKQLAARLKDSISHKVDVADIKSIINRAMSDKKILSRLADIKTTVGEIVQNNRSATSVTIPGTNIQATTNSVEIIDNSQPGAKLYRLVTYNKDYNPPARQHLIFRKLIKGANIYSIGIEGSPRNTPWSAEPLFDSAQQAKDFASKAINLKTKRNVANFRYSIVSKPIDLGYYNGARQTVSDLSNCTLVNTILGPAYIQNDCQYKEGLNMDMNDEILNESGNYSAKEKMQMFDAWIKRGRPAVYDNTKYRNENIARCGDAKLWDFRNVCIGTNLDDALEAVEQELVNRGLLKQTSKQAAKAAQQAQTTVSFNKPTFKIIPISDVELNSIDAEFIKDNANDPKVILDVAMANNGTIKHALIDLIYAMILKQQKVIDACKQFLNINYGMPIDEIKANIQAVLNDYNSAKKLADIKNALKEDLHEDIEKHDKLNPILWNEDNTLKPEVKDKVLDMVNELLEDLKFYEVDINVEDIILVGSNCAYNYTKDSDLDVHIIAETESLGCPKDLYPKLYSAYSTLFNRKMDIDFYGIPTEIYIETEKDPVHSNGIYSVMNDRWIKEPVVEDVPEIDKEAFDKEFKVWEDRYNKIIDSGEKELKEDLSDAKSIVADQIRGEWDAIKNYRKAADDLENINGSFDNVIDILNDIAEEEETHVGELENVANELDNKTVDRIDDGREEAENKMSETAEELDYNEEPVEENLVEEVKNKQLDEIEKYLDDIYAMRKASLVDEGEYSIGNLVFKEVRNKGYLDNLKDLKDRITEKELSLD